MRMQFSSPRITLLVAEYHLAPISPFCSYWCFHGLRKILRLCVTQSVCVAIAVIGFFLGSVTQMRTGQTVWAQLNAFPAAYLVAYGMVVLGSILNE